MVPATMNTLQLLLLFTINAMAYQLPTNKTEPVLPEPKHFKFEDQPDRPQSYGLIRFEGNKIQQFNDQKVISNEGQRIQFEENRQEYQKPNAKKKKRRRKPKQRFPNGPNQNAGSGYPAFYPGSAGYPGAPMYPGQFGPGPVYPGQIPYPAPQYKPRPSATSAALSAVTEALTSIALYDDAQCVPRLLCEAAGGTGSIPGAGVLQSIAGLQPLLTLLSAYNGISSSPLFVFGRAVFLGMTSKANPGTCRYAYPQCPNDPEQLVHYLNNHNGGFFRFFAAPELNQQQGLEQFYNQLSGQNYGLYQPQHNAQHQNLQQGLSGQNYGLYQPQQNAQHQNLQQGLSGQNYGLYQPQQNAQHQNLQQGLSGQNYDLYQPQQNAQQYQNSQQYPQQYQNQNHLYQFSHGFPNQQYNQYNQRPSPYGNGYGLYGQRYPYQQNFNQNDFKIKEMQKRILNVQNVPSINIVKNPKWTFPEDFDRNNRDTKENVRLGKVLKFPQSNVDTNNPAGDFAFPGIQSNRQYPIDSFDSIDSSNNFAHDVNDFKKIYSPYYEDSFDDDINNNGIRTLYVVRGNGDPKHPEVVHLAPGQTL